jgi:carboxyl-terminal processing protease
MGGTGLSVCLLLTLAAPPVPTAPAPRPAPPDPALVRETHRIATWLTDLAIQVSSAYPREVPPHKLLAAGLAELYEKTGRRLPDDLPRELVVAAPEDRVRLVAEAITALGRSDGITTSEMFVTAANGFARATDPYSGLIWRPDNSFVVSEAEFGMGFEIEGATGPGWVAYILESARTPGEPARPPATPPWRVHRVIPGSPAAKAGLRPGDRITHLDGDQITTVSHPALFRRLASVSVPFLRDLAEPVDVSKAVRLRVNRPGAAALPDLKLSRAGYAPGSVFGVTRRPDGSWDYMLDREAKVGYVRLGAVELGAVTTAEFARALADLDRDGAEALILDLRWCPGGYVAPITQIVGAFLPHGKTVATLQGRTRNPNMPKAYYAEPLPGAAGWNRLPLAVLVNAETTGGGEMIAAALQDHSRAVVIGQRTFGKANIMDLITTPLPGGIGYRVSTGFTLRPNGKGRHRFPDSKPTDEWGVRPDKGFEVPLTPDLSARLRAEAERHAIRPPGETEAVAFDDPLADPQRMVALRLLKEKLQAAEREKDQSAR